MVNVLVTGGCGFIGSNFIKYLLNHPETKDSRIEKIINLDLKTYAGQGKNIEHLGLDKDSRYSFILGDVCDKNGVEGIFDEFSLDLVFHFAAESHVDRSNKNKHPFERTNIQGTDTLAFAALNKNIGRFVHISTDEVYGSIKEGNFSESSSLNPSNPYAQTKMKAEEKIVGHLIKGLPAIITRSANNYGPYQFPEKILPLFITNLINRKKVPLMWSTENPGLNIRDWLHVEDNCRAIWFISQNGKTGEAYNIPGENEKTNIELTKMLLSYFNFGEEMIQKIEHRKAHDFRYSIAGDKLKSLGFNYHHKDFKEEINEVCRWYTQNKEWWSPLKNN